MMSETSPTSPASDLPELLALDAPPPGSVFAASGSPLHLKQWTEQVDARLEVMAAVLAKGVSAQRVRRAAAKLKVPVSSIRLWLKDPQVIRRAAVYGTALSLSAQVGKAREGDTVAFKTIAQVAGVLESGGPKIQVNTAVDARTTGNNESDKGFFRQFRNRVEKRIEPVGAD